ncbi:MAG TPA: hypothetical protein VHZ74_13040 [Bryobacteraceae bacterium]|nr:hypothetical protein [Bryobacteraceae bacterium]
MGVAIGWPVLAQPHPDFSGDWRLDKSQTPGAVPWGQTCAEEVVITQTASGLTLTIKTNSYHFSRNGRLHSIPDRSMGGLPNFVRKTETVANWRGRSLLIKVTELSEQTNAEAGKVAIHPGITDVHTLTLFDDGRRLTDERTGCRAEAPTRLHGRPYQQSDDFAYRHQTAVFIRH